MRVGGPDNNFNINGNNRNLNNNNGAFGMVLSRDKIFMHTYNNLYNDLCSYENLELAFRKARRHKTLKKYVIEFEKLLEDNLLHLCKELKEQTYMPKPLETFILRDPKTRVISKSNFRDRIVHHAICNIIEPIFEKTFIHDCYANRINKGTLKAIERFDCFKAKATKNFKERFYVLKADILHYFDTVDHRLLLNILSERIKDNSMINLISVILDNHKTKFRGKGMPLGNLTSQFFANIYLNKLDYYIKHTLRIKYYIRYVDDFIIMDKSEKKLEAYKLLINTYLKQNLCLELHPEKSRIIDMRRGITFLGLRIYYYHKLLKKSNIRKFKAKINRLITYFDQKKIDYDIIYDFLEGWIAYSMNANTYNLRNKLLNPLSSRFENEVSNKEYNRYLKQQKAKTIHLL